MTGNLFDVTFDGQSAIIGRERKGDPGPLGAGNAWIGQNPTTAFLAVAPWIVPDPGIADPTLSLAARRGALAAAGAALLPGSGVACAGPLVPGACENGYREAVVWHDVVLPDGDPTPAVDPVRARPPAFGPATRVTATVGAPQHAPRIAARGKRVVVAWHEGPAGGPSRVRVALSRNGGRTFAKPLDVGDATDVVQLHPAVAIRGGRVAVVWQEFVDGQDDDAGRIVLAWLDLRGRKHGRDVLVDNGGGAWLPAVAFADGTPVVAWIGERDPGPDGEPLEHVWAARALRRGRTFGAPVRVDGGTPVATATHLHNAWSPAIAADDRSVHVAWVDFRNYNWDVFGATSADGGATFGANVRIDDFPAVERLHERPSVAIGRGGTVHVAWTDLRAREPDPNVFYARSTDGGATWSPNRAIDGSRTGVDVDRVRPSNQWHPGLAADGDAVFVAWQDDRLGNPDVFFAASADGGTTFGPAERVDDTGAGQSTQTRPSLALGGAGRHRTCHVAWEDDRDGLAAIHVARRPCARP